MVRNSACRFFYPEYDVDALNALFDNGEMDNARTQLHHKLIVTYDKRYLSSGAPRAGHACFHGADNFVALGIVIAVAGMARPQFAAVARSTFGMIPVILAWAVLRERVSSGQWAKAWP